MQNQIATTKGFYDLDDVNTLNAHRDEFQISLDTVARWFQRLEAEKNGMTRRAYRKIKSHEEFHPQAQALLDAEWERFLEEKTYKGWSITIHIELAGKTLDDPYTSKDEYFDFENTFKFITPKLEKFA